MDSMGDLSFDEARRTIEGTPVPKSRSRGFSDEQEIDNLDKRLSYDTPISPIKTKPVGSVLIFQTGDTTGYDTGNHGALILLVGCVYGISHYQRKSSGKAQAKISPPEDVKGMSSVVPA